MNYFLYYLSFLTLLFGCKSIGNEVDRGIVGVWTVNSFEVESEIFSKDRKYPELESTIMSLEFNFKEDSSYTIIQNNLSDEIRAKMSLSENQIQEPRGRYILEREIVLLYQTIDYFGESNDTLFILESTDNEMVLKQKHDMFNIIYSVSRKK